MKTLKIKNITPIAAHIDFRVDLFNEMDPEVYHRTLDYMAGIYEGVLSPMFEEIFEGIDEKFIN
jgi:hypothetical protein